MPKLPPITVTKSATAYLAKLAPKDGGIRLSLTAKGCAGQSYRFDPAYQPEPGDIDAEQEGVTLWIDARAFLFVIGSTIDYQDDVFATELLVHNPQENGRCGCGASVMLEACIQTQR